MADILHTHFINHPIHTLIKMELKEEEFNDLINKVDRIFTCVVGDDEMGNKGLIERMEKIESDLASMKILRDRIIIGGGFVAGALWLLGQIGEKVFEFFVKK